MISWPTGTSAVGPRALASSRGGVAWDARGRSTPRRLVSGAGGVAARLERQGVPGDRGRRSLAVLRDLGRDLQAVRLAADIRGVVWLDRPPPTSVGSASRSRWGLRVPAASHFLGHWGRLVSSSAESGPAPSSSRRGAPAAGESALARLYQWAACSSSVFRNARGGSSMRTTSGKDSAAPPAIEASDLRQRGWV
jgi:hypothetical protein